MSRNGITESARRHGLADSCMLLLYDVFSYVVNSNWLIREGLIFSSEFAWTHACGTMEERAEVRLSLES